VALVEAGIAITALVPRRPTLEDLFFEFTEGDRSNGGERQAQPALDRA
jgi:hypothetical protein